MKRTHLISVVIAMLFILPFSVVSCSNSENGMPVSTAVSSVEIVTPTTTQTQTPTSTPTITPTPTPIPTLTHSAEDDLAMAPDISGLSKEVQDGKVVYLAAAGNEYGLDKGDFAGQYNSEISVEGNKVGGVALEPSVVDKILADELAKIPEGEKNMKVVIPLDITEVTEETGFNIEDTVSLVASEYTGREFHIMIMEFNNPLTFINPCIKDTQFNTVDVFSVDNQFKKGNGEIKTISVKSLAGLVPFWGADEESSVKDIKDIYYLFDIVDQTKIKSFDEDKKYAVGEKSEIQAISTLSVFFDYFDPQETTPNDLLKLSDGTVVFTYPPASVGAEVTSMPTN